MSRLHFADFCFLCSQLEYASSKSLFVKIHPVVGFVGLARSSKFTSCSSGLLPKKPSFSSARFHLRAARVVDFGESFVFSGNGAFDHEADRHAGLDAEHVVLRAAQLRVGAHVAAEIDDVDLGELLRHRLAKAVEGAAFDEAAVGDEGQHAVRVQPVAGPAEEARIHVVELGLLRGALVRCRSA